MVMQRVTTANFSILINRSSQGKFGSPRDLRQDCPLSPFFIYLMHGNSFYYDQ